MKLALEQAEVAYRFNEVPVGALVVSAEGKVLSSCYNTKEQAFDPC
ncbi:MAG: tRNA-specific adenosine deaminase, partial [Bdellovibrionota bacterium]